ncbi:tautomerase family protein [Streptococcus suis]
MVKYTKIIRRLEMPFVRIDLFEGRTEEQKHTKISSEEISDGRKYSLLFLYDKVEVSC